MNIEVTWRGHEYGNSGVDTVYSFMLGVIKSLLVSTIRTMLSFQRKKTFIVKLCYRFTYNILT